MKHSLFWLLDHYPETGESIASAHALALEQAVEADHLGFDSLWVAEHHFRTIGTVPNPAVLLAAISQCTQRIRLGPAVAVLPLRSPIQLAEDYALVDALSGGRLNMGVGSGSQPTEYAPFGIDFESRRAHFDQNLAIIRRRWTNAIRGQLGSESLNVAPVQTPAPPIYVATMNEEAAHRIGRAGDSLLTLVSPAAEGLDDVVARVRAHARGLTEADRAVGRIAESVVMMFAHVAETEAKVRATVVPALGRLMRALSGEPLSDAEAFYQQMRARGVGLFGTPIEVARRLRHMAEQGIEHVAFVSRFGGMSRDAATSSLQWLAPEAQALPGAPKLIAANHDG